MRVGKSVEVTNMMRLWFAADEIGAQYPERFTGRKNGLVLRFDKNVDPEVRRCVKAFCRWLRQMFSFPLRITVYIRETAYVQLRTGEPTSANVWGPYKADAYPYAAVAAGDYRPALQGKEKDDRLASILQSVGHELSHYYQWITDPHWLEKQDAAAIRREERQAVYYARQIVDYYANIRAHP